MYWYIVVLCPSCSHHCCKSWGTNAEICGKCGASDRSSAFRLSNCTCKVKKTHHSDSHAYFWKSTHVGPWMCEGNHIDGIENSTVKGDLLDLSTTVYSVQFKNQLTCAPDEVLWFFKTCWPRNHLDTPAIRFHLSIYRHCWSLDSNQEGQWLIAIVCLYVRT